MLLQLQSRIYKPENKHFTMQKIMHMKASVRFPPSFPCLLNSCVMRYISASFSLPSLLLSLSHPAFQPLHPGERRVLVLATGLCRPGAQRGASAILTPAHITRAPKGCANTSGKHFRSPPSRSVSVASSLAVSSAGSGKFSSQRV